jgi:hypothetical protein
LLKLLRGGEIPSTWLSGDATVVCLRGNLQLSELNSKPPINLRTGAVAYLNGHSDWSISPTGGNAILLLSGQGQLLIGK